MSVNKERKVDVVGYFGINKETNQHGYIIFIFRQHEYGRNFFSLAACVFYVYFPIA